MSYSVKEIFFTLQGEGANTGRAAVFCRFSGCNLWTGREQDRREAVCTFCDTDFVGVGPDGGRFATADALADAGHREATASARSLAVAKRPPSGPTPTKSVSQNVHTARCRSDSRPVHRLHPANRQNTAARPAFAPSP